MEVLRYLIEDSTIAELLGVQNFTNDESAILELVKNAYDAKALEVVLEFKADQLVITDNGIGMEANDIKEHWMHVGKSAKQYEVLDDNNNKRILAGSKGIGRFALARLGRNICISTKKKDCTGIEWKTDWNGSTLAEKERILKIGTQIVVEGLRKKWGKQRAKNLINFLSKTYDDRAMSIRVVHQDIDEVVPKYFPKPKVGINCRCMIALQYNAVQGLLTTNVDSDEFDDMAKKYCDDINLKTHKTGINMIDELKNFEAFDFTEEELSEKLEQIGNFKAELYFNVNSSRVEVEKFLYKQGSVPESIKSGVVLYRNAFSISAYEGEKDWLGLGKRTRKSPAAATHPTGAWRVRENQLSGKVQIDKKENAVLQDLSNRQGIDENIYYKLFIEIILAGLKEFERYRQEIIRKIDQKNKVEEKTNTSISDKIASNPKVAENLSPQDAKQLSSEIKSYKKASVDYRRDKADVEERYRYDVRILNVLATTGLKASSIAHEMKNDRNSIAENTQNIIEALKEYGFWDELHLPERTTRAYKNVPHLIESNSEISKKIGIFMDTMLSEVEKKQFEAKWQSIVDIINNIKMVWERDYAWATISIDIEEDICYLISEDIVRVIFDNLILNSIQQNEKRQHINIDVSIRQENNLLCVIYSDDGKGLDKKYLSNPKKILEVHETTRANGHGLGMWIVNSTTLMSGGEIKDIRGQSGFLIEFTLGGKM